MSVVNYLGMDNQWGIQESEGWYDDIGKESVQDKTYWQSAAQQESTSFGFGDFVKGLAEFAGAIFWGVAIVPKTFTSFGVEQGLANLLSAPIYFLYLIGIAQFLAGRSAKTMR